MLPYCSNGPNCLLYHIASFCISNLPAAWHFGHQSSHASSSNYNGRNAWKQNKGKKPSFHKGNSKATQKTRNELYKLPNLVNFSIHMHLIKEQVEEKENILNGRQRESPQAFLAVQFMYTLSPIASWMRMESPEILPMTSPVVDSVSKKAMSCLSIVLKYKPRMRAACLSPVTVQHDTSVTKPHNYITIRDFKMPKHYIKCFIHTYIKYTYIHQSQLAKWARNQLIQDYSWWSSSLCSYLQSQLLNSFMWAIIQTQHMHELLRHIIKQVILQEILSFPKAIYFNLRRNAAMPVPIAKYT